MMLLLIQTSVTNKIKQRIIILFLLRPLVCRTCIIKVSTVQYNKVYIKNILKQNKMRLNMYSNESRIVVYHQNIINLNLA